MATYYVWSGAGGAATGANWTNAFLTLQAGMTAASSGDTIKVHRSHQETGAGFTFTCPGGITIISVDKDNSDSFSEMHGYGYIRTTSTVITINTGDRTVFVGMVFEIQPSAARVLTLAGGAGLHITYQKCRLGFIGTINTASQWAAGGTTDRPNFVHLLDCTLVCSGAGNFIQGASKWLIEDCVVEVISGAGSPTNFVQFTMPDPGGATVDFLGCDLSALGTGAIVGDATTAAAKVRLHGCKLGSGYVSLGTQTRPNLSGAEVVLTDCAAGDTHNIYEYHDSLGSLVTDSGIYFTGGSAGASWKITTTANVGPRSPFRTPWLAWHHTGTASITPRLEILRDGSSTAYTDAEVWSEWSAKVTPGTVLPTLYSDRQSLTAFAAGTAGTAQAAGAGLGSWTGESGTAWSGKLDSGSAFTPAEVGDILARVCVAVPSATVYVDPQPRT